LATYYIPENTGFYGGAVYQGIRPDLSGTDGDDIYVDSKDTHGYPSLGDGVFTSGSDKYYLALDVEAKNRIEHPYLEGGGYPEITNFNVEKDKIFLPEGVQGTDIMGWHWQLGDGYGKYDGSLYSFRKKNLVFFNIKISYFWIPTPFQIRMFDTVLCLDI
jgi:hypothetical protein